MASAAVQDMSQWPAFSRYKHLDYEKQEIRILTIEPCDDSILCSLEQVPLLEAQPYFALSYAWGKSSDFRPIVIDDEEVLIRDSLWRFIKCLRDTRGRIRVWADAICINQLDISERDYQVTMMADIFRKAKGVIAWLDDAEHSFKPAPFGEYRRRTPTRSKLRRLEERNSTFRRLEDTLMRPYWLRLWIIQEVVVARQVWFMIGNQKFAFDELLRWFRNYCAFYGYKTDRHELQPRDNHLLELKNGPARLGDKQVHQEKRSKLAAGLLVFDTIARLRFRTSPISLPTLAKSFRYAECQDPRDHIYGLLGIIDSEERRKVVVDYSSPVLEVYLRNVDAWASAEAQERMMVQEERLYDGHQLVKNLTQFMPAFGPFRDIFDLQRLREDQSLRSKVVSELTIRCERIRGRPNVRLFALYDPSTRLIIPSTKKHAFARSRGVVYISLVTGAFTSAGTTDEILMYSTTDIESDDIFLSLPSSENTPEPSIILIARRVGPEVRIVGTGKRLEIANHVIRPDVWLAFQMPNARHTVKNRPYSVYECNHSTYHVTFNGMAIAQLLEDDKYMASFGLWDVAAFSGEHEILGVTSSSGQVDAQTCAELDEEFDDDYDAAWVYRGGFNRYASSLYTESIDPCRSSWLWG